jgi:hypothetical protein
MLADLTCLVDVPPLVREHHLDERAQTPLDRPDQERFLRALQSLYPVFNRYWARKKRHPMSGGIGRVFVDTAGDYLALRRRTYDFDLAPLPGCLELSKEDDAINRQAKLTVAGGRS